jgi:predicted kinase
MIKLKSLLPENIEEGVRDPGILKCVFSAGGPGSGKSKVLSDIFGVAKDSTLSSTGLKLINSDMFFEKLLKLNSIDSDLSTLSPDEFNKVTSDDKDSIRSKAKTIQVNFLTHYLNGRLGLIIDGTGEDYNKISEKKKFFESIGYDCMMIFVNTSYEVALERNNKRTRKLPEELVFKLWKNAQDNMGKFQNLFGGNFVIVDNTGEFKIHTSVKKSVHQFLSKPTRNRIGIEWKSNQV